MAAAPARSQYRRPRPGSLDRPLSARMYRGTWLLVGLPLLVAAFSVVRPTPLWFHDNPKAARVAPAVASMEASPSWLKLPGLLRRVLL